MYVQTTVMTTGKSEHTGETNEDACACSASHGVFGVSDGVGTLLFSRQWAHVLAQQASALPLLSNDPFEVEWWLRQAQKSYKQQVPSVASGDGSVQKKLREGSAATLALVNILSAQSTTVTAQMLAVGDSCIIVANAATGAIRTFPLEDATDFESAPVCLPTIPRKFNRTFHRLRLACIELRPKDSIILATDAVARWIITHPTGTRWSAFQEVASQTPDTWEAFIIRCRRRQEMIDDDATAIVIQLNNTKEGSNLSPVAPHTKAIIDQRQQDFANAVRSRDKEKIAVTYGSGQDFLGAKRKDAVSIDDARTVASAINEIRQVFLSSFNRPDLQDHVERAWKKHETLLMKDENRASIEALLNTLQTSGIYLKLPPIPPSNAKAQLDDSPRDWISILIGALEYIRNKLYGGG
jgi:hypothetical protein